jgi:hypothetical protein
VFLVTEFTDFCNSGLFGSVIWQPFLKTAVTDIKFTVLVISFPTDILNISDCLSIKNNDEHTLCQEEYQQLKHEFEQYKQSQLHQPNNIR